MKEIEIIEQLKNSNLFEDLNDISIVNVETEFSLSSTARADVLFTLRFGQREIKILGEVKTQVTPKLIDLVIMQLSYYKEIAPSDIDIFALICPYLSEQNQLYCRKKNINYIDLSGNMFLRIPGTLLIERTGRPKLPAYKEIKRRNPFAGASSRVIRVLLNRPNKEWTVTGICDELERESERQNMKGAFLLSISSVSKTIQSLDDELLIKRDNLKIKVPDPKQLLFRWAEKYRERYKWIRKGSFLANNPFGLDVELSIKKLMNMFGDFKIFVSGSAAANFVAPFVNIDRIDIFILDKQKTLDFRNLNNMESIGPEFLFFNAYDNGVAMYAKTVKNIKIVSPIQIYLDCYARGGRDAKQAEYLLDNVIEREWQRSQ